MRDKNGIRESNRLTGYQLESDLIPSNMHPHTVAEATVQR